MADSFGGGLAEGLNGLLGSLRNDRERKAQEQFKQKLIAQDNATNREIADRSRKQQALQMFGQGLSKIQENNVNSALTQLQGNATKHSRGFSGSLEEYKKQFAEVNKDINSIATRLSFGEAKANAKKDDSMSGLLDSGGAKTGAKQEDPNTPVLELLKSKVAERDQLKSILEGGMAQQQALQGDVEDRAQQLKNYTIDDALNTREAKVLQLSLGLTDDDVAQFRDGSKASGTDFNAILGKPFSSTIGTPKDQNLTLDSLLQKDQGIAENPQKRAILGEKLNTAIANLPKDVTSLKDLTSQDFKDLNNDQEYKPMLENALLGVKGRIRDLKTKITSGTATDADIVELHNINKMASGFDSTRFNKVRSSAGDDGSTFTLQFASELGTPETMSGLSSLVQRDNGNFARKGYQEKIDSYSNNINLFQQDLNKNDFSGLNRKKRTETDLNALLLNKKTTEEQRRAEEARLKAISDTYINFNGLKQTIIDPNYQYKMRPVDFGATK